MKEYTVCLFDTKTNKILKTVKCINVYDAEDTYFKMCNTNPVREIINMLR